jgi:hypothetical protein
VHQRLFGGVLLQLETNLQLEPVGGDLAVGAQADSWLTTSTTRRSRSEAAAALKASWAAAAQPVSLEPTISVTR